MSVTATLRKRVVLGGAALVLAVGIALPATAGTASADTTNHGAASLVGAWSVSVEEYSSNPPVHRSGTFTYNEGGGGTVQTSTGLSGTLTWSQSGSEISFHFEHNLPDGGHAEGDQQGTISGNTFTSTGITDTYDASGAETDSFAADFTSVRQ